MKWVLQLTQSDKMLLKFQSTTGQIPTVKYKTELIKWKKKQNKTLKPVLPEDQKRVVTNEQ